MSNILLVPIHLDALVLDRDQMVVEMTADFTRLPYCTRSYDINPDIANISEELVSTPFQNENLGRGEDHLRCRNDIRVELPILKLGSSKCEQLQEQLNESGRRSPRRRTSASSRRTVHVRQVSAPP